MSAPASQRSLVVSDHAVLRHLERRCGIDVEAARDAIAATCRRGADVYAQSVLFGQIRYVLRHQADTAVVVTALERRNGFVYRLELAG